MTYRIFKHGIEYSPRLGLEGPFRFINGTVLYYDPIEGSYYDPLTDFYVPHDEVVMLHQQMFDCLKSS
jgi:hypothetical protein